MTLSPKEIAKIFDLKPHEILGLVNQTFISKLIIPKMALPAVFNSDRSAGSVITLMGTDKIHIRLHRIRSDQMLHFYMGNTLEVLLLYPAGGSEVIALGHDIEKGILPQLHVPANTFFMTRMKKGGKYALFGRSAWIGLESDDVELGHPQKLMKLYPDAANEIAKFTKESS